MVAKVKLDSSSVDLQNSASVHQIILVLIKCNYEISQCRVVFCQPFGFGLDNIVKHSFCENAKLDRIVDDVG